MKEIYKKIQNFNVKYGRVWDSLPEAREFVKTLIEFDLEKRPDAEEGLKHPWICKKSK